MLNKHDHWGWLTALGGFLTVLLLGCTGSVAPSGTDTEGTEPFKPKYAFQDPTLTLDERVDDLVGRLTLEEKVSQMQQDAPAIKRLEIPAYHWWSEALHGVARNGVATVFPQAIGLAATWNPDLHQQAAHVIGVEARAKHHEAARHNRREIYSGLDMWSPNINIFRDPRWGRGQETYGEDPYLTGRMGVAFVRGLQGNDPDYLQIIATPKHFAVHSGPEQERHRFDAQISQIDLWTTYLPAFEACIREGHAYSVMGAYNRILGTPCCASPWLLTDILRTKWGFDGYVVSDVDAVADIHFNHQTTDTGAAAAALAVKAGCDLNGGSTYSKLVTAVHLGLIRESEIDISVKRLLRARMKLGMFDPPALVAYAQTPYEINGSRTHDQLALEVARQSMVLLKNDAQTLPLRKDLPMIAVIGPNADSVPALVGNYNGTPARPVTILQGIRNAVSSRTRIIHVPGCPLVGERLPLEEVVPASALFTDASCTTHGLKANYYHGAALPGDPMRTRIDANVDFDWSTQGRHQELPNSDFSARWTGMLVAPETGTYQLGVAGQDGFRLWIDGRKVVDNWSIDGRRTTAAQLPLEQGKSYSLTLEYFRAHIDPDPKADPKVEPMYEGSIQLKWTRPPGPGGKSIFADAVRTAQQADAVVMVLGLTADIEGEEMRVNYAGFNGGDRTSLDLPRVQQELLEAVSATGKPVVLVLLSGSAVSLNWAAEHVPAILETWYPGQQGGNAAADILFGDYNPAGRLPVTFYKSADDLPAFDNYAMEGRTYRYFRGQPLWPFGYGLSYTTFAYRNLEVGPAQPTTADPVTVRVQVRNTGQWMGEEVVQVYLSRDGAASVGGTAVPVPLRTLQGFQRVRLNPGEEKTVTFTLTPLQLALIDPRGQRRNVAGAVKIYVGSSSAADLVQTLQIQGPDLEPAFQYVAPQVGAK